MNLTYIVLAPAAVISSLSIDAGPSESIWKHLSSTTGDLPVPGTSTQQTACVIADLDKSGKNGFVLGFRVEGPALVWYRPKPEWLGPICY